MIVPLLHNTSLSPVRTRFVHSGSGVKIVVIYGKGLSNCVLGNKSELSILKSARVGPVVAIIAVKLWCKMLPRLREPQ